MAANPDRDRDLNQDRGRNNAPANDNGKGAVAPAPAGGALASVSLAALSTVLNSVDTTTAAGRTGLPMIQFKSREGGIWTIGQRQIEIDPTAAGQSTRRRTSGAPSASATRTK